MPPSCTQATDMDATLTSLRGAISLNFVGCCMASQAKPLYSSIPVVCSCSRLYSKSHTHRLPVEASCSKMSLQLDAKTRLVHAQGLWWKPDEGRGRVHPWPSFSLDAQAWLDSLPNESTCASFYRSHNLSAARLTVSKVSKNQTHRVKKSGCSKGACY